MIKAEFECYHCDQHFTFEVAGLPMQDETVLAERVTCPYCNGYAGHLHIALVIKEPAKDYAGIPK